MDDVLRKRLSPEELEQYERYDSRASIAGHFVVWPTIAGLVSYFGDKPASQWICLAIVIAAFPIMVVMGKRAGELRKVAEERFGVIMGQSADKKNARD